MFIPTIKGLRYPDEAVIRFFFKSGFHNAKGNVLELGSSNGNNLLLFYEYGWDVTGVDISQEAIDYANINFTECKKQHEMTSRFEFIKAPMSDYVKNYEGQPFDTLLLPGSFYYSDIFNINKFLGYLSTSKIIKENGYLFVRYRSKEDYRFGKGEKIGQNTFQFNFDETGEKDCINTFFDKKELETLFGNYYELHDSIHLKCCFENIQNNQLIDNCDYIFWAKVKNKKI